MTRLLLATQWLYKEKLIPMLVAKLDPAYEKDVRAARLISQPIAHASRFLSLVFCTFVQRSLQLDRQRLTHTRRRCM